MNVGDVVKMGDVIGSVGSTGESSAPHLHFSLSRSITPSFGTDRFDNDDGDVQYVESATVTVTFHMNRPGVENDSAEETTQTIGGTYNFPDEDVPTGYTFAGWYTSATGGTPVDNNSTVDGEVENLYAHWEAKT